MKNSWLKPDDPMYVCDRRSIWVLQLTYVHAEFRRRWSWPFSLRFVRTIRSYHRWKPGQEPKITIGIL